MTNQTLTPRETDAHTGQSSHRFGGFHLIATYLGCQPERLSNADELVAVLHRAAQSTGATLLKSCRHDFPNGGVTAVLLLSESHASLHTYPEHNSVFVDLFTCGDSSGPESFDRVFREFFQPRTSHKQIIERGSEAPPYREIQA